MANIFARLLTAQRVGMDKVVVGKAPDPDKNKTGIALTVAVFFDGTLNNRNNVAQRRMGEHNRAHPQEPMQELDGVQWSGSYTRYGQSTSYVNGYSNVSILEALNQKRRQNRREISVYVEGIATTDDAGDTTFPGAALGTGATGIEAKVQRGIGLIAERIDRILAKQENTYVKELTIDVFGFSRGAAAARHFVSLLRDARPLPARLGQAKAETKIKFVGLFDTVSSHGMVHVNDRWELGLRLGSVPARVVQLAAGNEYRDNFALTDISSSLGVGLQLTLPGAHSDLGGGYGEHEDEPRTLRYGEHEQLIAQGWYTAAQVRVQAEPVYSPQTGQKLYTRYAATATRRGLKPDYQLIPLGLMADYAREHAVDLAPTQDDFAQYALAANHELAPVRDRLVAWARRRGATGQHVLELEKLGLAPAQLHRVRNRYLHRSANDGIGMGERRVNDQLRRNVYSG